MTAQQTIELRRSEIRQRLGQISELQGPDLTDDLTAERDGIMLELRNSESQLQAAIEVRGHGDERGVGRRAAERFPRRSNIAAWSSGPSCPLTCSSPTARGNLTARNRSSGRRFLETDRGLDSCPGRCFCRGARAAVDSRKGWTPTRTSRSTLAGRKRRSSAGSLQTRPRRSWAFGWRRSCVESVPIL